MFGEKKEIYWIYWFIVFVLSVLRTIKLLWDYSKVNFYRMGISSPSFCISYFVLYFWEVTVNHVVSSWSGVNICRKDEKLRHCLLSSRLHFTYFHNILPIHLSSIHCRAACLPQKSYRTKFMFTYVYPVIVLIHASSSFFLIENDIDYLLHDFHVMIFNLHVLTVLVFDSIICITNVQEIILNN